MDGQELPFFYNFIAMGFVISCGIVAIAVLRRERELNKKFKNKYLSQPSQPSNNKNSTFVL